MTTYRMTFPRVREFNALDDEDVLKKVAGFLLCDEWSVSSMLKNVANACCDWQGQAFRYGTTSELIKDMLKHRILIKINKGAVNETN